MHARQTYFGFILPHIFPIEIMSQIFLHLISYLYPVYGKGNDDRKSLVLCKGKGD
jgi:hypothetical protein